MYLKNSHELFVVKNLLVVRRINLTIQLVELEKADLFYLIRHQQTLTCADSVFHIKADQISIIFN